MERTGTEPKDRRMIGLNFQTKSLLNVSVFGFYAGVSHTTLVKTTNEQMGFQPVLYNPTVQYDPLLTLANVIIYARGLYGKTLVDICDSFTSRDNIHFDVHCCICRSHSQE